MSVLDQKEKVFGEIAALRTLTNDFPELKINNSFPSINNQGNVQDFLIDLLKALVGYEELRDTLVDILVYATSEAEIVVKEALKSELKGLVACGVDPSLPTWLINDGITIPVKKIDFMNIMKINPITQAGGLIFDDVAAELNSTDFNTYLYYTIQDEGTAHPWDGIFDVEFTQIATPSNNVLNFKPTSSYTNLTDLNNDFVDSIKLFASEDLIINIIDTLFGSITVQPEVNKSEEQLEEEAKIESVIQCLINADAEDVFDDSYFEFTNEQLLEIKENASNRRNGIRYLKTCGNVEVDVPIKYLIALKTDMAQASTQVEKRDIINNSITLMSSSVAEGSDPVDQYSIELGFIGLMISALVKSIVNAIISPKVITIFLINYKIVYGQTSEYGNPLDFLALNKTLIKNLVNTIVDMIVEVLLKKVLMYITKLIAANAVGMLKEKASAELIQILSLIGIPQSVIRLMRENNPISI
tara:strand:- start:4488 stop:5900 length:1413 start_codon:yes stop_codon:yes gene_type:complete